MSRSESTVMGVVLILVGAIQQVFAEKVGPEFLVNSCQDCYLDSQDNPSVAALADGGFVVTWTSYGQDGEVTGVYGQRYTQRGAPRGDEFRVNTTRKGYQNSPAVAGLANGGFVVIWEGPGRDSWFDVHGQIYGRTGTPRGGEFRVNTSTINAGAPSVAALADGSFVVTWAADDGFGLGVYGQRFLKDLTVSSEAAAE